MKANEDGLMFTSFPEAGILQLSIVSPEKFNELHRYLNRALNTADDAPQWLFKLCDALEQQPIPEALERKT